ncbi:NAD(P)H-quinone oxidoreductase [Aestuariirhabdus sp. Z084]|uniref:NAD(P)H-quinone oxidoreductase n=1 Tax=Aestuariirhabdus haliotis TaxID=2918751 RepID=UPI00201B3D1E|nr:NAD(P)H-quinone oxidoreductase [Aestuariirhabdus haliotis]MCL6417786.1 NAD(P)H-quinone oxidoreductase [Aestuariirhabdus haliotis]MCL6420213.1 NAD(P)H-quinone oxidoreductase [Aestuariirhabdus haliotis]
MITVQGLVATQSHQGEWVSREVKPPAAGEVCIRIHASGVNRADLMQLKGYYPPPPGYSDLLGLECAGVIESVGDGVDGWKPGDAVMALLAAGGFSNRVVCDVRQLLPLPKGWDMTQGAGFMEAYSTAWLNLYRIGDLQPEERVLIYAGASGVGSAAIQLCNLMDNPVVAVVGSQEKADYCRQLGAQTTVLRDSQCWHKLQALAPFDLLLDPVAGDWLENSVSLLAMDGRLVLIGLMGGRRCELDAATILMKRIRIQGSTLRGRTVGFKGALLESMRNQLWQSIGRGQLSPVVDRVFTTEEIDKAFAWMANNSNKGKVIIVRSD